MYSRRPWKPNGSTIAMVGVTRSPYFFQSWFFGVYVSGYGALTFVLFVLLLIKYTLAFERACACFFACMMVKWPAKY